MKTSVYVAVDIGATGMKMVAASCENGKLEVLDTLSEKNPPLVKEDGEYANVKHMLETIHRGLCRFQKYYHCISLGIDTYGNGYGILDEQGKLLMLPHHYRDRRIDRIMDRVHEHFTDRELYEEMGNVPIKTRGLFHLYEDVLEEQPNIRCGKTFLPLPNLLEYLITGEAGAEKTIASVLYLLEKNGENWNYRVLDKFGIPTAMFGPLSEPGVLKGKVTETFAYRYQTEKAEYPSEIQGIPVITVAGHDTESALAAIPELDESKVFVSTGTSFIVGARVKKPVVTDESYHLQFKNMRGVFGTYSLCKDVPGFWILERCMEKWKEDFPKLDYKMVCDAVKETASNHTFINISDDRFRVSESDILTTIREYCIDTGQEPVIGIHAVSRCLFESYALYIRHSIDNLTKLTGKTYTRLEIMNGGVRNEVLLQMFADACRIPVAAESPWASACGNLLLQMYAVGAVRSEAELNKVARASCQTKIYKCNPSSYWEERLQYMLQKNLFKEET